MKIEITGTFTRGEIFHILDFVRRGVDDGKAEIVRRAQEECVRGGPHIMVDVEMKLEFME